MYIDGGSGTFESCSFEENSAIVSRHAHVGRLRLSAVNVWDAFCVLFRTFVFGKVHIVSWWIHEMCFVIFGFFFCRTMYVDVSWIFSFFLFYKTVQLIGICRV